MIPKKVRQSLIDKVSKAVNSKEDKKFIFLLVSQETDGLSTGFLSTFNDNETLGLLEKSKIYTYERMTLEEASRTTNKKFIESQLNEETEQKNISYVT